MHFVTHAIVGLVIGLAIMFYIRYRHIVVFTTLAAIAPDVIDKPIGLLFTNYFNGHMFFHTLLLVVILSISSFIMHWRFGYVLPYIGTAMVFIHQIMDRAWMMPTTWFYPLLGDFPVITEITDAHYQATLWFEMYLTSPDQIVFTIITIGVLLWVWNADTIHISSRTLVMNSRGEMSGIYAIAMIMTACASLAYISFFSMMFLEPLTSFMKNHAGMTITGVIVSVLMVVPCLIIGITVWDTVKEDENDSKHR